MTDYGERELTPSELNAALDKAYKQYARALNEQGQLPDEAAMNIFLDEIRKDLQGAPARAIKRTTQAMYESEAFKLTPDGNFVHGSDAADKFLEFGLNGRIRGPQDE